jgi:hypothetical protein
MGWAIPKIHRTTLLQCHYLPAKEQTYDAVVVDMCSEARRVGSGPRAQSAQQLCTAICKNLLRKCKKTLVIVFDDQDRMHEQRSALHKRRYKAMTHAQIEAAHKDGKCVINNRAYKPADSPYTARDVDAATAKTPLVWNKMWGTTRGKTKGWALLYAALQHGIRTHAETTHACVIWHTGDEPWVWPRHRHTELAPLVAKLTNNTYGEGDQRAAEAAQVLAHTRTSNHASILIQTIDTDMLIQTLCAPNWHGIKTLHLQLKNEAVDVGAMCRRFGNGRASRTNAAFWMLACGGVDYCKGLTRFGYKITDLLALAAPGGALDIITLERAATITLHVHKVLEALAKLPRRNMKRARVADFAQELNAIMFCIVMFAGASARRTPCGGPVMSTESCFGENDSSFTDTWVAETTHARHPRITIAHTDQ